MLELFGEPIYIYTRKQAIEDGVLIDVTETAKEAGFKVPVAVTCALHEIINTVSKKAIKVLRADYGMFCIWVHWQLEIILHNLQYYMC